MLHCLDHCIEQVLRSGTERAYTALAFNDRGNMLASVGGFPDYLITLWAWEDESITLRSKAFSQVCEGCGRGAAQGLGGVGRGILRHIGSTWQGGGRTTRRQCFLHGHTQICHDRDIQNFRHLHLGLGALEHSAELATCFNSSFLHCALLQHVLT